MCAEIELKDKDTLVGYLLLFIGTEKKGTLKDNATLYYGYLEQLGKTIKLKKLRELMKLSINRVNPTGV